MMVEQHYDEEVLAGFLSEPIDAAARDKHLDTCSLCKGTLQSIRDTTVLLKKPEIWDRKRFSTTAKPETLAFLRNVQQTMAAEEAAACVHVALLLAGDRESWAARLAAHPEWRTAGLVRQLIAATDQAIDLMPPNALEITRLAIDVAEQLPDSDRVVRLRGNAWYERGYALFYTGAFREALVALANAESQFARLSAVDHEIGRLNLVRGMVHRALEHFDEALPLITAAAAFFREYGDIERWHSARLALGITLWSTGRFREALNTHLEIVGDKTATLRYQATALQNAAICHRELGDFDSAIECFVRAINAAEWAGMISFRAKARWTLARIFGERQRYESALAILTELRDEFEVLGMTNDVAMIALDIAELLLATGRFGEVARACKQAITYFEKMQLTSGRGALTAVTYLCESAVGGSATTALVSDLRDAFFPDASSRTLSLRPHESLPLPTDRG
ncbi:MAG TPA: tetratricopeptide repeat protein [Thermoanaerobaculia bacterium]|jgi:tetratricopeptide (TPR) repeat protein|nr:tetratricopeptide repeat protein [Thermoanaerobaculia bacterium]